MPVPNLQSHARMWCAGDDYPPLDYGEFEVVCDALIACLQRHGSVNVRDCDFHVIEDCYADRTQKVECCNPHALSTSLISGLQATLAATNALWRIVLVHEQDRRSVLWLYPEHVIVEVSGKGTSRETESVLEEWRRIG